MEELLAEIERHWAAQGIAHGPPVTPDDVAAVEARYGVRFPDDVRAYFLRLNGSERGKDGPMDEESIAFWHLSELRPLSEEAPELRVPGGESYFVFADFLHWSFVYALRLSADETAPAPVMVVHDGDCVIEAAPSLRVFLERYLARDPDTLFPEPPAEWRAKYEQALPDLRAQVRGELGPSEEAPRLANRREVNRDGARFARAYARSVPPPPRGEVEVVLKMVVDAGGMPGEITALEPGPDPMLTEQALRVATRMRFTPAKVAGRPVRVWVTLPITFRFW